MMFVQAISKSRETEPYKIQSDLRTPPMVISLSGPIARYHVHSLLCAMGASGGPGDQTSTSRSGNKKDAGMTPTMEEGYPLMRSFFPRAFGSAPKRRRQKRSLIRMAFGPPKCSSSELKSRPSAGETLHTCKKRGATKACVTFSGRAPEVSELSSE